ncbi:hypothetical protein BB737_28470 [Mycobacterium avium subsp. hominissuis]|uniref:Helix-turn-helix domain containing protein n=1 Tax=Mycobacterium paraffinicum TaxID=53378 RepID=A0ABP8RBT6_9MYCO|nr:hypothetical protein [Mycobacterium avium]ETA91784.1 hypothetical protein O982_25130 [Mycobacterium avium 10-5581]PBJ37420.1 hypothetical protein BI294_10795 [Mycobacterium avium subsp. hominissuis]PBJ59348.1 hypothetical protein BB737_28470 [Mycobacterium avium subsp. hominissuis]QLK92789.1 hypothetical protein BEP52_24715 [Mycobacterium avium subsp. hominissuis]QWY63746.1 hypothetical protein BJP74_24550 [Mycobacterium avium subsp. hominissuis]
MTTLTDPWANTGHDEAQALPSSAASSAASYEAEASYTTASDIDELAVIQVAHDGQRLRLRGPERDEAVRRMHGRVELELIAWRLYTTTRTVHRVAARLGLTEHHSTRRELATTAAR